MSKLIFCVIVLCFLGNSGCVSSQDYQQLLQERNGKQAFVERLRNSNEALTNEKFMAISGSSSKIERLEKLVQTQKDELAHLQQKYDELLQKHLQINESYREKSEELESLVLKLNFDRIESVRLLNEAQERLRLTYNKPKIKGH